MFSFIFYLAFTQTRWGLYSARLTREYLHVESQDVPSGHSIDKEVFHAMLVSATSGEGNFNETHTSVHGTPGTAAEPNLNQLFCLALMTSHRIENVARFLENPNPYAAN